LNRVEILAKFPIEVLTVYPRCTLLERMVDEAYQSYQLFKSWSGDPDQSHDRFFAMEMASLNLSPRSRMVEVGFGEGRFLDFARRTGHDIIGFEIIEDLVHRSKARGHDVSLGQLSDLRDQAGTFDLVAALDLIEHLTTEELKKFFGDAALLLRPGGFVFLRFPNGLSPFSLPLYNGDITHRSHLTNVSISQLAAPLGLRIVRFGNAARDLPDGLLAKLRRRISYLMRSIIETILGLAYFGRRIPMDPNLVVILAK
jgi:2-polyprenyl-3-methyl-5-hydroxy-6-metoxy-1,4-benzoquinol methylase